ncbi:hypothetical protein BACCIP111883_01428 [Sutcliffiella rhizosphaerae]|uniref:RNA polymerase sigma factor 70 region 4 type 2 domain-containing protein n=2 Tax=Sutcliffiella rhizosphaerae TaxID=2880967 RepID=A0ABM8YLQ4_9BACI|nr:hypothetical protein BACCIP111883_01428 [Sutcliffiella rhizosphaerae]
MNYCADERKKRKREPNKHLIQDSQYRNENEFQLEIQEAIEYLAEPFQMVIRLRYLEDLKLKDIAIIMSCPENTIKTWLTKSLKLLRQYWDERGGKEHV